MSTCVWLSGVTKMPPTHNTPWSQTLRNSAKARQEEFLKIHFTWNIIKLKAYQLKQWSQFLQAEGLPQSWSLWSPVEASSPPGSWMTWRWCPPAPRCCFRSPAPAAAPASDFECHCSKLSQLFQKIVTLAGPARNALSWLSRRCLRRNKWQLFSLKQKPFYRKCLRVLTLIFKIKVKSIFS